MLKLKKLWSLTLCIIFIVSAFSFDTVAASNNAEIIDNATKTVYGQGTYGLYSEKYET